MNNEKRDTNNVLLEGLHIPLTTPFHPDGRLATHKLASNVARYSKTPAAGLIVLGPSGEPTLLNDDETREVLRTAAQSAAPEKVLIAGISRDSVHATLALAEFAAEQNYDAILVGVPSFFVLDNLHSITSQEELKHSVKSRLHEQRTFFRTVADRSPLPVILLYRHGRIMRGQDAVGLASHPNIIGMCGTGMPAVIQHAQIAGIIQNTTNIRHEIVVTSTFAPVTRRMSARNQPPAALLSAEDLIATATALSDAPPAITQFRTRKKAIGFQTIGTHANIALEALNSGAIGIAPAFTAAAPQAAYEVFAAWKDSDQPLAEEKQTRIIAAARLAEASPAALKYACDLNGYFGGQPRLPHLPLTGEQRAAIEELMHPLRN